MKKTLSIVVIVLAILVYFFLKSYRFEPLPNGLLAKTTFSQDHGVNLLIYDQCLSYFKNDFHVPKGGVVIDIGANRGFFSMLASKNASKVFSFEPITETHRECQANLDINNIQNVKLHKKAVCENKKPLKFTSYVASFVSTAFTWSEGEKDDMKNMLLYYFKHPEDSPGVVVYIGYLLPESLKDLYARLCIAVWYTKLSEEIVECMSVSDVIEENKLEKVDLLKVDAEKAEAYILKGIKDEDWKKLDKVFVEAHTVELKDECVKILESKGFSLAVESEDNIGSLNFFNIYARPKEIKSN
jgi:FkbM family methyltransferase